MPENLDDCFAKLIKNRAWYKNSSYDRKAAYVHKNLFIAGRLPDELKRMYLLSAGYKLVQEELWSNNGKDI